MSRFPTVALAILVVLVAPCVADAASILVNSEAAFLSLIAPGYYLEDLNSLSGDPPGSTLVFTQGPYSYSANATNGLYAQDDSTPTGFYLSTEDETDSLVIDLTLSGNITAIGGFFFSDNLGAVPPIRIEVNDGTFVDHVANRTDWLAGSVPFVGFVSDDGTPYTSLTLTMQFPGGVTFDYPSYDDLYVGTADLNAPIPEPSTGLLVLGGLLFAIGLKSRKS